jgi:hypothetical protein
MALQSDWQGPGGIGWPGQTVLSQQQKSKTEGEGQTKAQPYRDKHLFSSGDDLRAAPDSGFPIEGLLSLQGERRKHLSLCPSGSGRKRTPSQPAFRNVSVKKNYGA